MRFFAPVAKASTPRAGQPRPSPRHGLANSAWPGLCLVALSLWCGALALGRFLLRTSGASGPAVDSLARAYGPTMRTLLMMDAGAGLILAVSLGVVVVRIGQAPARHRV